MQPRGQGQMDRLSAFELDVLERICPGGVSTDEDLSSISQWKIGGRADLVLRPSNASEVARLRQYFTARGVAPLVIGSTTNLLFDDAGLRVPCIRIGSRMADLEIAETDVYAGAGYWVPLLARKLMDAGLTGLEHMCGIPGTLGGLICMNGGSQRKGIGSHVVAVDSVNAEGIIRTRYQNDLDFSYRHSIFQDADEIVTGVHLRLERGARADIRKEMLDILVSRSRKFPRKLPSCGSTFVSDPVLYKDYGPPGAIIERLGFKGYRVGGAEVSPVHANFIVNVGDASAQDILAVIRDINEKVKWQTGREMLAEVRYVRPDGVVVPASKEASTFDRRPT